jgi:hypothetical protein
MFEVELYEKNQKLHWDKFIKESKNGSFLFCRDFIEYHSELFKDFSLLIYDNKRRLVAVLPANIVDKTIHSHQGLSYGGVVLDISVKLNDVLKIFKEILIFLKEKEIERLVYKKIPHFYNKYNTEEDEYVFFRLKAILFRIDTSITINCEQILPFQNRRKREIKKAKSNNLKLRYDDQLKTFWNNILEPNLLKRFGKKPVHNLKEIEYLKDKFSDNICQVNVYNKDNIILAGTTLFFVDNVVHAQYISTNDMGKELGAIDFLFNEIIHYYSKDFNFFDFGICNENEGKNINKGLLDWKEGFGARTHIHKFFEIDTSNYILLND